MTSFQSIAASSAQDAEQGDLAAVVHGADHVAQRLGVARHFEADVEALVHVDLGHHLRAASAGRARTARVAPIRAGEREAVVVDVGDDDVARADMAADRDRHQADRPGAGDQHVLADEVEGQRGMDGVAERIEDRGDLVGDGIGDRIGVGGGDRDIIGEGARPVDADAVACCGRGARARRGSCGRSRRRYGPRRKPAGRPSAR